MNRVTRLPVRGRAVAGRRALATRSLAGVTVPHTLLVAQAIDYARQHTEPFLFNHVMRSWLFAAAFGAADNTPHDSEVLAIATVLHDLRFASGFEGPFRFEVEAANAARDFALDFGLDDARAQLVWDCVAPSSMPSLALHEQPEVALCSAGTALDGAGLGADKLSHHGIAAILDAFPRLEMKQRCTAAVCGLSRTRPHATYGTFAAR